MSCFRLAVILVVISVLTAQEQTRRATIRGGGRGDSGKCTIEVDVDDVAEVSVSGDNGWIRTLAGQPAYWKRFECTGPIPSRPGDFRFTGVDGRGSQQLVRDPRDNRGTVVVRIEDPKSGREGYTFDLEWRGGSTSWIDDRGRGEGSGGQVRDAIRACQDAVRDRLDRDGYRGVSFRSTDPDRRRGRDEYIVGAADARGGSFDFACAVDFRSGRVRQVDVLWR